ncbi:50S ribosomal protein L24e [Candidatus Pacearchaeota archaeon CG10_big_fil_rev_8_21_14_0_10_34_76]|nr:MAG: 50S ribosomal protein L24e [Candidatus Pacearchaeota archaeon CG10_big_fil_rev_8_21_14_0_10_34_76]
MAKCVFCGKDNEDFKGVFLMKNDGSVNYYCSSKCRKNNLKLGRDKRKIKWTESFRLVKDRRLEKEKERVEKARTRKAEKKADKKSAKKK